MNKEIEKVLSELYHSLKSDVSFSSPLKLYRAAKLRIPDLKLKVVKNWLSKDLTYTLHHPIRRSYTTRIVLVHYIDDVRQILQIFKIYQSLITVSYTHLTLPTKA